MDSFESAETEWLCSSESEHVLADLAGEPVTPALIGRLRKTLTPGQAAAAVEQAELRQRGRQKFRHADQMLFTRRSLEQATDEWVARYKAARFAQLTVPGRWSDFCCGIGGDLIGLASIGASVTGVDRDRVLTRFSAHNLNCYATSFEVCCETVDASSVEGLAAWHADPDRRAAGRRTTSPDLHEPPLELLDQWLQVAPHGAVKFAPAARLSKAWLDASELEWISREGSCRQLVAWRGALAQQPGQRTATRILSGPQSGEAPIESVSFRGNPDIASSLAPSLGDYIFDLDPALLAAGLSGAVAVEYGLAHYTPNAAYLTGPKPLESPLIACFAIEKVLTFDRRKLADWFREHGVGQLEIKCRGVDLTPEQLRKELRLKGDQEATLIVSPAPTDWAGSADRPCAIICRRAPLPGNALTKG